MFSRLFIAIITEDMIIADSTYRTLFNTALLKLSESGIITELKKKWWTQKRGGGKCRVRRKTNRYDYPIIRYKFHCVHLISHATFRCVGKRRNQLSKRFRSRQCGWCILGVDYWCRSILRFYDFRISLGNCSNIHSRKRKRTVLIRDVSIYRFSLKRLLV
jgi:hypothetical protein